MRPSGLPFWVTLINYSSGPLSPPKEARSLYIICNADSTTHKYGAWGDCVSAAMMLEGTNVAVPVGEKCDNK